MKLTESAKNIISLTLRIAFSGGLLLFLFSKIDFNQIIRVVKDTEVSYLLYALAAFGVIVIVLLVRWWIFIGAVGLKVPFKEVVRYYFIGLFFNLFLPSSTGGDIMKSWGLCRHTPHKARVVASVVLDRLSGFMVIVLVAFVTFIFSFRMINDRTILLSILILAGVCFVIVLILFNETLFSFGCRIFNRFPRVEEALMSLHRDIVLVKDKPVALLQALGVSSLNQIILAFTFYLLARALHYDVSMIYFLIFVPLICVVSSLPSIGGLGVRDAGAVYFFGKIGIDSAAAVSMSLMSFVFMVAFGLIGGLVYVAHLSPRRV